mmetsp:Transcript_62733/g.174801  ORF Transcript_62733/g.174801 Transcript_62733/m.174801 type:complete len:261 (-) Transcript_62733:630-1412(-)
MFGPVAHGPFQIVGLQLHADAVVAQPPDPLDSPLRRARGTLVYGLLFGDGHHRVEAGGPFDAGRGLLVHTAHCTVYLKRPFFVFFGDSAISGPVRLGGGPHFSRWRDHFSCIRNAFVRKPGFSIGLRDIRVRGLRGDRDMGLCHAQLPGTGLRLRRRLGLDCHLAAPFALTPRGLRNKRFNHGRVRCRVRLFLGGGGHRLAEAAVQVRDCLQVIRQTDLQRRLQGSEGIGWSAQRLERHRYAQLCLRPPRQELDSLLRVR